MKTTYIIFPLFLTIVFGRAYTQTAKPNLHVFIAADLNDAKYGVQALGKINKVQQSFETISKSLDYNISYKTFYYDDFNGKTINNFLKASKSVSSNDMLVFYYIGRGLYPNAVAKNPDMEFRNKDYKLNVDEIKNILNSKGGRLALVIADCNETYYKTRSINFTDTSDTLNHNQLTDFEVSDTLILPEVEKKYLALLPADELAYYNSETEKLSQQFLEVANEENTQNNEKTRLEMLLKRLSDYPNIGFPASDKPLTKKFRLLPDLSIVEYTENRNFDCVIDSLYKKRAISDKNDPMNILLDRLIDLPASDDKNRPLVINEKLDDYVIRKLFFTTCGAVSAVNGTKPPSKLSLDYTEIFFSGLSNVMSVSDPAKVQQLSIENLFVPANKTFFQLGKSEKNCPAVNSTSPFYVPDEIPSVTDIQKNFSDYALSPNSQIKQNSRDFLAKVLDVNARIMVKNNSSPGTRPKAFNLDDYLKTLTTNTVKPKKMVIPAGTLTRNINYSKVQSLTILEYY